MTVWAIADLHLAFATPDKSMEFFEGQWIDYTNKIEKSWKELIQPEDLVLLAGDISWAMKLQDAKTDLEWIDKLPGTKVMIKGNHDYWWDSISQLRKNLPPSIHAVQNDVFKWKDIEIGGVRLWDTPEYNYSSFVAFKPNPRAKEKTVSNDEAEKVFVRDLSRLEMSLKEMKGDKRIAMIHYPPIGPNLEPSRTSKILEKYKINQCVFGHIHLVEPGKVKLGKARGVEYHLTAADYLNFVPKKIEI